MKTAKSITNSIIYKSDQRIKNETDSCISFETINPLSTKVFKDLTFFNDVYISPGKNIKHIGNASIENIFLPIVGSLLYKDEVKEKIVEAENSFSAIAKNNFVVQNNYTDTKINYLHLGFKNNNSAVNDNSIRHIDLDKINSIKTVLSTTSPGTTINIGIFSGRTKSEYILRDKDKGAFLYIINGAFEIEDRLLEHRDGLLIWGNNKIEFESLSEFAILLIIETPLIIN